MERSMLKFYRVARTAKFYLLSPNHRGFLVKNSKQNKENVKNSRLSDKRCATIEVHRFFIAILKVVFKLMLAFDKYVLKAYFGIETPLYKCWWRVYSAKVQRTLDKEHEPFVLGGVLR